MRDAISMARELLSEVQKETHGCSGCSESITKRGIMKVSRELADVLKETSKEVESWPQWKRSLDPIGDKPTRTDEEGSQCGKLGDTSAA
jgi:hypothetical protein